MSGLGKLRLALMAVGLGFAGAAGAQVATTVVYSCERGARVTATYLTVTEGAFAVIQAEGRQVALRADSTEGRFASVEEGAPYVWWVRNGDAELMIKVGATDIPVLSECREG